MATLSYPAPVSRGLGGFTESFLQGLGLMRQFREQADRERQRRLEEQMLSERIAAAQREAGSSERLGGLLDVGLGQAPTLAQGPGAPAMPSEPSLSPGAPVPGGQGPLTLSRLQERVGGRGVAELTQAGLTGKLAAAGVLVPEEEARRRADYDRVMTEVFRPNQDEAERLIQQGTPEALEKAYLLRSRAWRGLAPALTEAHRLTAERNAEEYLQKAASVRQDREEGAREARDAQRRAKAYQAIHQKPDSADAVAAVVELVTQAESKSGRQDNAKLVQSRFEALLKRTDESGPVRALMDAVQEGLAQHPGDAEKAWDAAFRANPEAFMKAASHAMAQGKAPADPVAKRLFGPDAPKDRMQAAHLVAVQAGPVGSPVYMKALKEVYSDLGAPDDAPKLRDVLTRLRGQEESTFRTLLLRLDSVRGSPEESLVQQEMQTAQANMRALDAELRKIGIPLAPPKATGVAVPPGYKGRARPAEGADPKLAFVPPPTPTREDALAEKQRLLGLGHTPESAYAAMKSAGWQ